MKLNLFFILTLFLAILAISVVSAEVNELNFGYYATIADDGQLIHTQDPITDFHVIGYVCGNQDCSTVTGTLWNGAVLDSTLNYVTLTYPTNLIDQGYGIYFYKEGYFPYELKTDYAGTGDASNANDYLSRAESCRVPLKSLTISHNGTKITVSVNLTAGVSSPVKNAGPLNYIPESIASLYAVDSLVDFKFVGPETQSFTKNVNLPASEDRYVSVTTVLKAGKYNITVTTKSNDVKCLTPIPESLTEQITIEDNRTETPLPIVAILSPESKTYTNKTILVNLRYANATSVYYNWNGVNVNYTGPTYVDFNEGSNTLNAYAVNAIAQAHTSVTFLVNTTSNQTENELPTINLISPQSIGYTNRTILVNIQTTKANSVWFEWKGRQVNYSSPQYFTFDEGWNNLTAHAQNSFGITSKSVDFYINTTLVCPFQSLPLISIISPLPTTYNSKTILVSLKAINATSVWFTANNGAIVSYSSPMNFNFNEGSNTLTAFARNPCGINQTSVIFNVKTSSSSNGGHHDSWNVTTFPTEDEGNQSINPIYPVQEDNSPIVIKSRPIQQSSDLTLFLLLMLGLGVLLLLILLFILILRR